MIDKLIEAIGEIVGGDGNKQADTPPPGDAPAAKAGFVPDDEAGQTSHDGQVGHRLDQLVSDAKQQIGDKPQ